jgi:hypothetical protein
MASVDMVFSFLLLPLMFFLPGFFILRGFCSSIEGPRRIGLVEIIISSIIISIVVSGFVILGLAAVGYLSVLAIFAVNSIIVVSLYALKRKTHGDIHWRLYKWETIALLILVLVSVALFFHPSEEITARHDIGVYLNTGINIGRTGSIQIEDQFLANVPTNSLGVLYSMAENPLSHYEGLEFPDFVIVDSVDGTVLPIQPHLAQVWMGTFYMLFGIGGVFWTTPLFGLISVLVLYFLVRSTFGFKAALISSLLMSICYPQVFFAQYSSPEMLFQLLFLSGTFCLFRFLETDRNLMWGVISAFAFGQLLFVRIDGIFVFLPLLVVVLWLGLKARQGLKWVYFIAPLFVSMLLFLLYSNTFLSPYFELLAGNISAAYGLRFDASAIILGLVVILASILGVISFATLKNRSIRDRILSIESRIWKPLIILTTVYLVALFLFSPEIIEFRPIYELLPIGRGTVDPVAVLALFISPIGVAAGFLGIYMVLLKKNRKGLLILALASPFLFIYLLTIPNNPAFPWLMRRQITVVVPVFMILTGFVFSLALEHLKTIRKDLVKRSFAVICLVCFLVPVAFSVYMLPPLLEPQFGGYTEKIENISNDFDSNDIILDDCRSTDAAISLPLKYAFGKNSIYLWDDNFNRDELGQTLAWCVNSSYDVFFLSVDELRLKDFESSLGNGFHLLKTKEYVLLVDKVQWEWNSFSNTRTKFSLIVSLYQIVPNIG